MPATAIELLTVCRISRLTTRSVAEIESAIAAELEVKPAAVANREPVYDRAALAEIVARLEDRRHA